VVVLAGIDGQGWYHAVGIPVHEQLRALVALLRLALAQLSRRLPSLLMDFVYFRDVDFFPGVPKSSVSSVDSDKGAVLGGEGGERVVELIESNMLGNR
jgi:hypothetical protein